MHSTTEQIKEVLEDIQIQAVYSDKAKQVEVLERTGISIVVPVARSHEHNDHFVHLLKTAIKQGMSEKGIEDSKLLALAKFYNSIKVAYGSIDHTISRFEIDPVEFSVPDELSEKELIQLIRYVAKFGSETPGIVMIAADILFQLADTKFNFI